MSLLRKHAVLQCLFGAMALIGSSAVAQSVGLPTPRLLTTMPMGGLAGSQVEIVVTGEYLDGACELQFSCPGITATPKLNASGEPPANTFVVTIDADVPADVYEARLLTRLGISSSRVFSVDTLPEVIRDTTNTSMDSALRLDLNSICNAATTARAVDHYWFVAQKGQRVIVNCSAKRIDSKLNPVVIVGDAPGT